MMNHQWTRQKLLTFIFAATIFLPVYTALAMRRKQTDSILEIMDTREIEKRLAERRLNATRDRENPMIIQNDLDDDYSDLSANYRFDRRRGYHSDRRRHNDRDPYREFNDTSVVFGPEILTDMQDIRSDKLLKSSKKALYVTRKEYLKKDWCKTEPLVQRIREEGCLTRTIVNRFCYGQCNSFYIPKSPKRRRSSSQTGLSSRSRHNFEDEDLTGAAFRSCGFCKPKKFTWVTITLRCPSMVPQLRKKRIQRIKQCRCMAQPLD